MRRRLVLVAAATTSMIMLAFVIPLALLVRTVAEERALTSARLVAGALAPALSELEGDGGPERVELALSLVSAEAPGPVTVVTPSGASFGEGTPPTDAVVERARAGEAFTEDVPDGQIVVTPVTSGPGVSVVQVQVPESTLRSGVTGAWATLAGLGVVLVAGAVVVADRLGRSTVRPVSEVAAVARRLADGDLDARTDVDGPREIADVALALDTLADRIEDLVRAERESAADLSHRLRTPLTALRLDVEALPAGDDRDRLAADVESMADAVDRLIVQSRMGRGAGQVADAVAAVRDRAVFWAPLLEDEDRHLRLALPHSPAFVEADGDDLAAALDALLGNVVQHTPVGSPVALEVAVDDDRVLVVVEDGGPGLAGPEVRARGHSGGSSTGLGLDICDRLARAAGGALGLGTSDELGGARIVLVLPVASPR